MILFKYIAIIYGGTLVVIFYNLFASILRALGDSKTPLYFFNFIISNKCNFRYCISSIYTFRSKGNSYSNSSISRNFFCVLCYVYMKKKFLY